VGLLAVSFECGDNVAVLRRWIKWVGLIVFSHVQQGSSAGLHGSTMHSCGIALKRDDWKLKILFHNG
jgi:hypothetical protein